MAVVPGGTVSAMLLPVVDDAQERDSTPSTQLDEAPGYSAAKPLTSPAETLTPLIVVGAD
jgi:hypothetical protein